VSAGVVVRVELLDRVSPARLVLVEAPGGSGKTTFAEQLVADWEGVTIRVRVTKDTDVDGLVALLTRGLRRAGLGDDADVVAVTDADDAMDRLVGVLARRADGVTLFLDDLHLLLPEAASSLAAVIADLPPGCRAILSGRALDAFDDIAVRVDARRVGLPDLQLESAEIAELLGEQAGDALVAELLHATDGWPAAVALAAARLRHEPTWSPSGSGGVKALLHSLVDEIAASDPSAASLARLPMFDEETITILIGERGPSVGRLLDLPTRTMGRWKVVPASVRELIAGTDRLPEDRALEIARHFHDCGETPAAVALLRQECEGGTVLSYLRELRWTELAELGLAELRELVEQLSAQRSDEYTALLVAAARAVELTDRTLRGRWLAEAAARADRDGALARSVAVELARDTLRAADVDGGAAQAEEVLQHATKDEPVTRGRALVTIGMRAAFDCTAESLTRAARTFAEAAEEYRRAGETRWQAETLARLGYTALYMAGHPAEGQAAMAEALALLPVGDRVRAFWLTNYADVLDFLGRDVEADAAVREALDIGVRRHDDTTIGMAWWTRSWLAAHRGNVAGLRAALAEVERHRGAWLQDGQEVEYLGSSAEHLALVGDLVGYHDYIARAEEVATRIDFPEPVETARAWYESLHGDPQAGLDIIGRLEVARAIVPSGRARRLLFAAVALLRLDRPTEARATAIDALEAAEAMGVPDLHHRMHRALLDQLGPVLSDDSVIATELPATNLQLLGGFGLTVGGTDRTPQPGHPATLVKLLALRSTMTVESAIDELWPDADVATGRARLRNLLNRLKERAGPIVVRDGETLRLDETATVDATAFDTAAAAALSAPDEERVGRARHALALYTGELLPGDLYEDWATLARARLQRRFVSLADLVAADSMARGDLDEAARLLDLGIAAEPLDESRALQLCELLTEQGRLSMARGVARRCIDVMATLDITASPDLVAFAS
jgi:DNA-binding SARP family transcriptional activator